MQDRQRKYRGVAGGKGRVKYFAYIKINKRQKHLGVFATAEQAARAYDAEAIRIHGEHAVTNFGVHRRLTKKQEEAYRLCSPDFYGLTRDNAGLLLGVVGTAVTERLKLAKRNCPELFPLHTKRHRTTRYEEWMVTRNV